MHKISVYNLIKSAKILLPVNKDDSLYSLLAATNNITKEISTVLNTEETTLQKQLKLEALMFGANQTKAEMKFSLSHKIAPYLKELEELIQVDEPRKRDPGFLAGTKIGQRLPTHNLPSLEKIEVLYQTMALVGHSMPLSILYYTSQTIQEIMSREMKSLNSLDTVQGKIISGKNIKDLTLEHAQLAAKNNAAHLFKLTEFSMKIACQVNASVEKATYTYLAEIEKTGDLAELELAKKRVGNSPVFELNSYGMTLFANIIGIYLEKLKIFEHYYEHEAIRVRKKIISLDPDFYFKIKAQKLAYANQNKK